MSFRKTRKTLAAKLAVLVLGWSAAHAEQYTIPLFLAPGTSGDPQGVLRIVNDTGEAATVQVYAIADDGTRAGPATIALDATAAAEFDAAELRSANAARGLSGGLGSISGDVRLTIDSDVPIVPLAFVRASDGTLSAMHDTVRGVEAGDDSGGYTYEVPIFNLSTEMAQASRLRLINPGDGLAAVTIAGRDDTGAATARGDVALTLAAGGARTLTARQLEAGGAGLTGRLGAGLGRWRLTVSSDRPLQVVNVVESPAGHWNNLSTTAARGAAPADRAGFDDRFVGETAVLEAAGGRFTLMFMDNGRFSETVQADGMAVTSEGGYDYAGPGPDAGRLTLDHDDGRSCQANWYFSSRAGGWFASRCAGGPDPDETRSGGMWFVGDDGDDGGGAAPVETTYGPGEALPGFGPGSDFFSATSSVGGGASVSGGRDGWTATMGEGGWFRMRDGTRYTCASAGGCEIVDGTVTRGSVTGRAPDSGGAEQQPRFAAGSGPGNQSYTVGTAIPALTLPAAGGDGPLTYSLSPQVPGLIFNATANTRELTGTPSRAGTYNMTYRVRDTDGDTDSLTFAITVADGSLGVCQVGMTLGSGQSCAYPGTADEFSVNARGRGSFLGRLAGIRIRFDNETVNGRVYDFEASHQGEGVWRIDRIAAGAFPRFAAGSGPGDRTYAAGTSIAPLTLPPATGGDGALGYSLSPDVPGLSFNAATRQLRGTPSTSGTYRMTYTASDEDGDADTLTFTITVTEPASEPDLVVESASVSDSGPAAGATFTLRATVRNRGEGQSGSTTLRYYRSSNATISRSDTQVGTDSVGALSASRTSAESISLTAPSSAGTYYYGACVDSVAGESDTRNNCSTGVRVSVPASEPDLVVESASVSDSGPAAGATFTLRATVRNRGEGQSGSTTLRYYRSSNATISRSDTQVGTDSVGALSASRTSAESISLTAPSSAGTYYYGACVDSVTGESDTDNNCSSAVSVTVSSGGTGGDGSGDDCVEVNDVIALGEGESCTITQALVAKYSLNRVSVRAGDTASCSGGRVRLSFFNAASIRLNGLTIRCR